MASKAATNLAHSSMSTEFSILRKLFSSMVGERRRKMMILYLGRKLDISIHDGRGGLPQTAHRNSAWKIFFAIRIKILWWWPEIVVNLNWTCKIFSRYRRCCCFFWGHYVKIWRRIVVNDVLYKSWSSFINGGKELFCTKINSKCQSTRDNCSQ